MNKKNIKGLVALGLVFTMALTACSTGNSTSGSSATKEIGVMLNLSPIDEQYIATTNNSGMSGTGGRTHLHSNKPEEMYVGSNTEFIYDIGNIDRLGELHIWNYNEEGKINNGLKEVKVSYSEDNVTYTGETTYELAQATGVESVKATNTVKGNPIDFNGVNARYIKIEVVSNYGGEENGLSELRLFRYKQPIVVGENISASPLERYINEKWSAKPEDYNYVNGAGLSEATNSATHDNNPSHMFTQKSTAFDFIIDLKGQYPVGELVLWNYNDPNNLNYGLKDFKVKVSDDCTKWETVGSYTLEQADGSNELKPSLSIDMGNISAHYIQIEITNNYGGDFVGLSEVSAFLGEGWYSDEVQDYTAMFSNYEGWSGADGVYSVSLDGQDYNKENSEDKDVFFIFSDTIISQVDSVTNIRSDVSMVNNTNALLKGIKPDPSNITFNIPEEGVSANIKPSTSIPATKTGKEIYYWLGDTFVSNNYLYVFALRIDSVNTMFGFEQVGVDLARYEIVDGEVNFDSLTIINDENNRLCDVTDKNNEVYFGGAVFQSTEAAGVLNPDGYVYIYGYNDVENVGRQLVVSRVKPENIEEFSTYEYLDGSGNWVNEVPKDFTHLESDVAPECSVTQIQSGENKGKYLFVWSFLTNSATIKASISDTPYTPFTEQTTIYTHDSTLTTIGKGNNTYNAKGHPVLSNEGELIISYNVNGQDCFKYGDIYRPRFLRLAEVAKK